MAIEHGITWSPEQAGLDEPRVRDRTADLRTVFVDVGPGRFMVEDAAAARAMAAAFTQAAWLLDAAAGEGDGK